MTYDNLKIATISLEECLDIIQELAKQPFAFTEKVPTVLKKDLNTFLVGKTLSKLDGKEITYDMRNYHSKLINQGIDYPIKWSKSKK
jgi:hypothetical protein